MALPNQFVIIDESGHPRTEDKALPRKLSAEALQNLKFAENGTFLTELEGADTIVEAFDDPLVAQGIQAPDSSDFWKLILPFGVEMEFSLSSLTADEWDRFHGLTTGKIPFVLSPPAQDKLFSAVDEYTDESLKYQGKEYILMPWIQEKAEVADAHFWSEIYRNEKPGWDLGKASVVLTDLLPRLKIPKARILVLGSGPGHDAAYFAEQGHVVTAVDISNEAIKNAKANYPNLKNITWVEKDIFQLPSEWNGQFDIVFEHTCYCAINPKQRNELVKTWLRLLAPQGHLLAVFFAVPKKGCPPFGSSEWEIRQRLKSKFQFVFWGRWRQSKETRQGQELAVYAQKKASSL